MAELVRAGIQSVTKGQNEAARALGLNESQRLRLVVLPQSLKVIIPPLIGVYLSLMKDTSLGVAIGFPRHVHGFRYNHEPIRSRLAVDGPDDVGLSDN